nr:DUF4082 domain-containing protein [Bradyrhizobium prioritasuperba]
MGRLQLLRRCRPERSDRPVTHTRSLWSSTGTLLATATFTNETTSGWQTITFSNPVSIAAGTTYVASFNSNGRYAATSTPFSWNVSRDSRSG